MQLRHAIRRQRNTRSKSNHWHCNAKEMSRGIRNKGDIFVCLNRIWSEKNLQISDAKLQIHNAKVTSISARRVRARNPPKA